MRPKAVDDDSSLSWYSAQELPFQVSGLAWFNDEHLYRRLPKDPPFPLPEGVDYLANHPSGGQIRFQTDAKNLVVRVRLSAPADMPDMPATGQCRIDCYLGYPGEQHFYAVTVFEQTNRDYQCGLFVHLPQKMRMVTLNLPLYQGVEEVLVGLDPEASILPPPPYESDLPIIVYGTSNTQGGCASRPGMSWTNILSRRLNREFINMGFSGSGKGEPDVARNIALIPNPGCFVLDYEGNAGSELLRQTLPHFIEILREAHPTTPILVLSVTPFSRELEDEAFVQMRARDRDFQRSTVEALRQLGDVNIFFMDGRGVLGEDFTETLVDGVHTTDLGFMREADALEPKIRDIIR